MPHQLNFVNSPGFESQRAHQWKKLVVGKLTSYLFDPTLQLLIAVSTGKYKSVSVKCWRSKYSGVPERLNGAVLKIVDGDEPSVGSNPTPAASAYISLGLEMI